MKVLVVEQADHLGMPEIVLHGETDQTAQCGERIGQIERKIALSVGHLLVDGP
jgi:hypothetical protein